MSSSKVVTIKFDNIGLGNVIWIISSSIGISQKRNATCYLAEKLKSWQDLSGFCGPFPSLKPNNLPNEHYIHEKFEGVFTEKMFTEEYEHMHIRCGRYLQSCKYFSHCDKQIRDIFQPNDNFIKEANTWLKNNGITDIDDKICIHIRGGDMKKEPQTMPSNKWFEIALAKITKKAKVIIFSDDMAFVKSMPFFSNDNFIFATNNSMMLDFTLMTLCNYFILSRGTFSWWATYLSKSRKDVFYHNEFLNTELENNFCDYYPENWHEIKETYNKLSCKIDIKPSITINDKFDLLNYYYFKVSDDIDINKISNLCNKANNMWNFNISHIEGSFKPTEFNNWTILIDKTKKLTLILSLDDNSTLEIFRSSTINSKINVVKNNLYIFPAYLSFKCKNVAIFSAIGNTFC